MYCASCGTPLAGSPAFCSNCGARVVVQGTTQTEPQAAPPRTATPAHPGPREVSAFQYFKRCYTQKYATFTGRARRREFWFFLLFLFLFSILVGFLDAILGMADEDVGIGPLAVIWLLASLVPWLAVEVRRLHDTNRSGWWVLLNLIPYVGGLALLVFMAFDSQPGVNKYGPNPKEI